MLIHEPVHLIGTGGTINKVYNPVTEKPELSDERVIRNYLSEKVKSHIDMTSERVCLKDSLDLTEDDRQSIYLAVKNAERNKIIVTHGTSTMEVSAAYLQERLETSGKTVILTGAMIPLKEFAMSDAGFNLGYALAQVQTLPPGVYICMHGATFKAGDVHKDVTQARFVAA